MPKSVVERFSVLGAGGDAGSAGPVAFVDGSADDRFRPSVDLELSHWVPNRTPDRWKADSSTEICLNFAADPPPERFEVAINNHVDVDGMLSVFSLVHSAIALEHRRTIIDAAEMGDFSAGVSRQPFFLAQELTLLMQRARHAGWDAQQTYQAAFELVPVVLEGDRAETPSIVAAWNRIEQSVAQIADGEIDVEVVDERLVSFVLPPLEGDDLERALRVPAFNPLIDDTVWLWPHARSIDHGEAVHLVSVPGAGGCFHDVWLPGYAWADTPNRWAVPGLRSTGTSNEWRLEHTPLDLAVDRLQRLESNPGVWTAAKALTPFASITGRGFPVVAAFVDQHDRPAASSTSPVVVASTLEGVFTVDA